MDLLNNCNIEWNNRDGLITIVCGITIGYIFNLRKQISNYKQIIKENKQNYIKMEQNIGERINMMTIKYEDITQDNIRDAFNIYLKLKYQ